MLDPGQPLEYETGLLDDRTESYYQLLINVTLSEDLTNEKKLVKKIRKILHFMILFKISVLET